MNVLVSFVQWNPLVSIIVFSFLITLALTLVYRKLTDKKELDELKNKQKELRERLLKCDGKEREAIQKEMLECSAKSLRLTLKPMLITYIPILFVFYGLKKLYMDMAKVGNIISWNVTLPIIGDGAGWLLSYIIFSLIFSIILQKILK